MSTKRRTPLTYEGQSSDLRGSRYAWEIFVSHASADAWLAKQIALHIEECGAVPFLSELRVAVGTEFEVKIKDALAQAREFLVLLTPWSLERPYVWMELGAAWYRHLPIIGVLYGLSLSELQARTSVPVLLKSHELVQLNEIDTYFDQLLKRVAAHRDARFREKEVRQ